MVNDQMVNKKNALRGVFFCIYQKKAVPLCDFLNYGTFIGVFIRSDAHQFSLLCLGVGADDYVAQLY